MRKKAVLIPVLSLAAVAFVGASLASSFDLSALPDPGQVRNVRRGRGQELPSSSRSTDLIAQRTRNHSKRFRQRSKRLRIRVRHVSWK
jgi:hypothetical protein